MAGGPVNRNVDPKAIRVNNSLATVFSLINSMVGSTMLVLPILFTNAGLVTATMIMIISGVISCKTCCIFIKHLKEKEFDV